MKIKDIVKTRPNINAEELEQFLNKSEKYRSFVKTSMFGSTLDDRVNISSMLEDYSTYLSQERQIQAQREQYRREEEQKAAEEQRRAEEEQRRAEEEKRAALAAMLISSGFSLEGYRIVKYSGYISGDDAVQVDRGTVGWFSKATNVGNSLMASLSEIRSNALAELKEAAYALGCNAVIGVDFDYITLDPQTANSSGGTTYLPYIFGVTANGNAVIIEKIEDDEDE